MTKKQENVMARRKRLYVFAAVMLGALAFSAWRFWPKGDIHYTSDLQESAVAAQSGINLSVPEGWVSHDTSDGRLEFVPPVEEDSDPSQTHEQSVKIEVTKYGALSEDWKNLDQEAKKKAIDLLLKDEQVGRSQFGFVNPTTTEIKGQYGIYGETIEVSSHYKMEMRGLAFVSVSPEGEIYKAVAIVPKKDFAANRQSMQKVIESFTYDQETEE